MEHTFYGRVERGAIVNFGDSLPEPYVQEVSRIMGFQALAEIVGGTMVAEWVPRAPSLQRKLMYTAKVQDELGHAQVLLRACEDLGLTREKILEDYLAGKSKLLNIFHYGFDTWEEMAVSMLLQNSAAIVQFQSLVQGSYRPYVRALQKIMKEESFHYNLALDMIKVIARNGTSRQIQLMQEAIDLWYPRLLAYFGPSEAGKPLSNALRWRIKVDLNDTIREQWLTKIVSKIHALGFEIHDPLLKETSEGKWSYTMPDWNEVRYVIDGNGPRSHHWTTFIADCYGNTQWVRTIMEGQAAS